MLFLFIGLSFQDAVVPMNNHMGVMNTSNNPAYYGPRNPNQVTSMGGNQIKDPIYRTELDPSKGHNKMFSDNVKWSSETFASFVNSMPQAGELMNRILHSFGLPQADATNDLNTLMLPDPHYLLKVVEESLAIHASFKEFLRKVLENVQQYLSRSSMLLAEQVITLKSKYHQIRTLIKDYNETKSDLLKSQYIKELVNLREEVSEQIRKFQKVSKWRDDVVNGVSANL